jgi:hypothetical protein
MHKRIAQSPAKPEACEFSLPATWRFKPRLKAAPQPNHLRGRPAEGERKHLRR